MRIRGGKKTICWFCYLALLLTISVIDRNAKEYTDNVEATESLYQLPGAGELIYIEAGVRWLRMNRIDNRIELENGSRDAGVCGFERCPEDSFYVKSGMQP